MSRVHVDAALILAIAGLFLTVHPVPGADKARAWQEGKVLDSERVRYFAGTVGDANTTYGTSESTTGTDQTAVYRTYEAVVIEGATHVYQARQRRRWLWSKLANLTVNGSVKFAVENRKLFLIDDDGKEHELEIVKQTLKQQAEAPKPATP